MAAPVITSAPSANGTVGTAFSYSITVTGTATSYTATGLPSGLSLNTGTGVISGTPTAVGASTASLTATNTDGTSAAFALAIAIAYALVLSPQFAAFTTGAPNGLNPNISNPGVGNRLILQDGTQGSMDDFNMDVLSVPFKVFAGADWRAFLPSRGTPLSGFPNMVVWDPLRTYTVGKAWVDLRILLRGLINLNGVSNTWNTYALNPVPKDAEGLASAQISGTDGQSSATITFTRPQTTYRFVATSEDPTGPTTINDALNRAPQILDYSVHYANLADDDEPQHISTGFNLGVRTRVESITPLQIGAFFQHEWTIVQEYYDTAMGS